MSAVANMIPNFIYILDSTVEAKENNRWFLEGHTVKE
jgi:hypothetical protein